MKVKIQIKNWSGSVLFELEKESNTIRNTLVEAVQSRADLYGADLREANLCGADLREADLREANLYEADLREADLREANLYGADLREANLYEANLRGADLYEANLRGADLCGADLREADLRGADLRGADLCGADLREADLREANLYGADLREANLCGADLREADLREAKNAELVQAQTCIVAEGAIIGWKLCKQNKLVKLRIPEEAKRSNSTGRKCRAEYADVLEIIDLNDKRKKLTEAVSQHNNNFVYKVGERIKPDKWNEDRWEECAEGIHFYITRLEAENHQ